MTLDEQIANYLDGDMSGEERRIFEQAMSDNPELENHVREMQAMDNELHGAVNHIHAESAAFREQAAATIKQGVDLRSASFRQTAMNGKGNLGQWFGVAAGILSAGLLTFMALQPADEQMTALPPAVPQHSAAQPEHISAIHESSPAVAPPKEDAAEKLSDAPPSSAGEEAPSGSANVENRSLNTVRPTPSQAATGTVQESLPASAEQTTSPQPATADTSLLIRTKQARSLQELMHEQIQQLRQSFAEQMQKQELAQAALTAKKIGVFLHRTGDFSASEDFLHRGLNLARKVKAAELEAELLGELGLLKRAQAKPEDARIHFERCLKILQMIDGPRLEFWRKQSIKSADEG